MTYRGSNVRMVANSSSKKFLNKNKLKIDNELMFIGRKEKSANIEFCTLQKYISKMNVK